MILCFFLLMINLNRYILLKTFSSSLFFFLLLHHYSFCDYLFDLFSLSFLLTVFSLSYLCMFIRNDSFRLLNHFPSSSLRQIIDLITIILFIIITNNHKSNQKAIILISDRILAMKVVSYTISMSSR
mmetsp:Transcript_9744/g.10481  ORF Transcript_9744/g.10481 Transcript_9744/m.10481 type:complete len:127 (-) Transcript_9744:923-1303(-)